jgi:hypothetical protein
VPFSFYYNGGIAPCAQNIQRDDFPLPPEDLFLMWLIIGEREISFAAAKSQGLVKSARDYMLYETGIQHVKVFTGRRGGSELTSVSFYLDLAETTERLTIRPIGLTLGNYGRMLESFRFEATARILTTPQALNLFPITSQSAQWLLRGPHTLPKATMDQVVIRSKVGEPKEGPQRTVRKILFQ